MGSDVEILTSLLEEKNREIDRVNEKLAPLLEEKEVLAEKIKHYERLIALETGNKNKESGHVITRKRTSWPSAISAIRYIIDKIITPYSFRNVEAEFNNVAPELNFSRNSFYRLMEEKIKNNEVKVVKQGVGRAPTIYENLRKPKEVEKLLPFE